MASSRSNRGRSQGGARKPAAPSSGGPGSTRGRGRPAPTSGRTVQNASVAPFRARGGAARTGGVRAPGEYAKPKAEKGLGGEQIEGRQAVRELLIAGKRKVYEIWMSTELEESEIMSDIVELAASKRVKVTGVARKKLEAEARSEAPQGVLAKCAPLPEVEFDTLLKRRAGRQPFLVAVDGVTDPGNLGALIRSLDGSGASGLVLPRHRAVHVTPTVAKAAAGAVEHVPMAIVGGLPNALLSMKNAGIWVVGLDDDAERSLFDIGDLAKDGICMVMGAEGAGLSRLVRERCDVIVSIPMRGRLSSLNVSAAAALACYEVARHRSADL